MKKEEPCQALATGQLYSPAGCLRIGANENGVIRIEFAGEQSSISIINTVPEGPALKQAKLHVEQAKRWLADYFSQKDPGVLPALSLQGTDFQKDVWAEILKVPYGQTVSYGQLARKIALKRGVKRISAQAVGTAVGKNPVPILIPCHRIIQADGHIGSYTPDVQIKLLLLKLEQDALQAQTILESDKKIPDPFA